MKNINWKNIIKGAMAGILLLSLVVYSTEAFSTQTERDNRYLSQEGNTKESGGFNLGSFQLSPKGSDNTSVRLDKQFFELPKTFLSTSLSLVFRQYGTAVFDSVITYGDAVVDYLNTGYNIIRTEPENAAKLKVNGLIRIESLADGDPNDPRLREVCTNDVGILSVCGNNVSKASARAVNGVCIDYPGTYTNQPAIDNASGCQSGVFVDVLGGQSDTVHKWSCYGTDGGQLEKCSANQSLVLDSIDLGISGSKPLSPFDSILAFFVPKTAEAASSLCSERDNLNDNGVYRKYGSAYIRYSDRLSFVATIGNEKSLDYTILREIGPVTTNRLAIYNDNQAQVLLPNGEYLISGDSVINEKRDPLEDDDGLKVPSGTPVSAISLVVQGGKYSFEACNDDPYLSQDEIRTKDMNVIQQELEKYYQRNGRYPSTRNIGTIEPNRSWANSSSSSWANMATKLGLQSLPLDPKNDAENTATIWTGDQRYSLFVDETSLSCNNRGQVYLLTARFDDQSVVSPGAPTCDNGRNYFKKTVGECKDPACNATWDIGSWESCSAGTQTRTVQCQGSDGQETRVEKACETQDGPKPTTTQSCSSAGTCQVFSGSYANQPASGISNNGCSAGNFDERSDTSTQWRWSCQGLNGGSSPSCSATKTTYAWTTSNWGACNTSEGSQSRTVECLSSTNVIVSDSFCSGSKPTPSQSCAVAGSCKTFNSTYASQPATTSATACNDGTYTDISDTTRDFRWQCTGLGGGSTVNCSGAKINQNPISEYTFDVCEYTGSGNEIVDSISRIDGRIIGATSTTDINSKIGRSLKTDGNTGYTIVPHDSRHSFSERMSLSFWMNPSETPDVSAAHILDKWSSTSNANYVVYYSETGSLRVYANVGGSWTSPSSAYTPPLNAWTHVAWTYDYDEGGQLYINGSPLGSLQGKGLLATNTADVNISHPEFNGRLDEVKIYADRLSPAMIASLYNAENNKTVTINCLSNDQKRERDIAEIKELLAVYYDNNGQYPSSGGSIEPNSGWENSGSSQWDTLATTLGVSTLPKDPINPDDGTLANGWTHEYRYYYYSKNYGCDGQWYMLFHKSEDNPSETVGNVKSCNRQFTYSNMIGTGECASEFCDTSWSAGGWGSCSAGTQTRTVQCIGSEGTVTSNSNCWDAGIQPATSQSCASAGICKPLTGNYTSQPGTTTTTACNAGTYNDLLDGSKDTNWSWQCRGINGGANDTCSANRQVNGICGSSNGGTYTTTPPANCGYGVSASWTDTIANDDTWNWDCRGLNGGATTSCSANFRRNAVCQSFTSSYATQPATGPGLSASANNGCSIGTFDDVSDTTNQWNWNCNGVNGGATSSCSATRTTYRWITSAWESCDATTGTQSRDLRCQDSTGGTVADSLCSGIQPSTSQSCTVNALCESYTANYTSQPATNSSDGCTVGTYSDKIDGPYDALWTWQCNGKNGGTDADCSANVQKNGMCKSFNATYSSQPATSTSAGCHVGLYTNISNTNANYRWSCSGSNGGSSTVCNANSQYYWSAGEYTSCDPFQGTQSRIVICTSQATRATVSDSLCTDEEPIAARNCPVTGSCNTTYNGAYGSQPATNTSNGCTAGAYLNISNSKKNWNWQCNGLNGSANSPTCSAERGSSFQLMQG